MLYEGADTIADLHILDPYQAPRIKDVKATLQDQQMVIVEMQLFNVLGFDKRVLYVIGWANPHRVAPVLTVASNDEGCDRG